MVPRAMVKGFFKGRAVGNASTLIIFIETPLAVQYPGLDERAKSQR
jgi:hypothetical protein